MGKAFSSIGHFFASAAHGLAKAAHAVAEKAPVVGAAVAKTEVAVETVTNVFAPSIVPIERLAYRLLGNAVAVVNDAHSAVDAKGANLSLDEQTANELKALGPQLEALFAAFGIQKPTGVPVTAAVTVAIATDPTQPFADAGDYDGPPAPGWVFGSMVKGDVSATIDAANQSAFDALKQKYESQGWTLLNGKEWKYGESV